MPLIPHFVRVALIAFGLAVAPVAAISAQTIETDEDQFLQPQKIQNPIAVFAGLDKVTGRIVSFEVLIDETVQFGALQVTPRICFTRPPTEAPLTTGFVEVDEVMLNNQIRQIFTGWMFADSPSVNAVEHPVYDVWLTDCRIESGEAFVGN